MNRPKSKGLDNAQLIANDGKSITIKSTMLNQEMMVNELGELMKPGYLTAKLPELLESNGMRRIRFHDLRHSCASLLLSNGVSLKDIQAWLGHSTISTTANIYVHQEFASKINSANAILQILPMDKKESEQA